MNERPYPPESEDNRPEPVPGDKSYEPVERPYYHEAAPEEEPGERYVFEPGPAAQEPVEPAAAEEPVEVYTEEAVMEEPVGVSEPLEVEEPAAPARPRRRWLNWILGGLASALLLFLAGFLLAYFLLYRPAEQARLDLSEQLAEQQELLAQANQTIDDLDVELAAAQAALAAQTEEAGLASAQAALEQMNGHVLIARLALAEEDELTARQALRLVAGDVQTLREEGLDAELVDMLAERLQAAQTALAGEDLEAAREQLRLMSENIQLVSGSR